MACKTEKARSKKQKDYVKRMSKSKDVKVLDSDSDDDQTDSDHDEFLLDEWDEWMAN